MVTASDGLGGGIVRERPPSRSSIVGQLWGSVLRHLELGSEARLDAAIKPWLAFAAEKLDEVALLARYATGGGDGLQPELAANAQVLASRHSSGRVSDAAVRRRVAGVGAPMARRQSPYAVRRGRQERRLGLPTLPTTTIGSFPQTAKVRAARAEFRRGTRSAESYQALLRDETARVVRAQEDAGIDVLVHGELERTDMVEYFGEQLSGFAFTDHGWVQSYGSRCVKPPIIYGDVWRPKPMTVEWARYAQSLTARPVKGMLTGPVTMLQWSFVRDDQPRADTCRQIALAIRDEVADLERLRRTPGGGVARSVGRPEPGNCPGAHGSSAASRALIGGLLGDAQALLRIRRAGDHGIGGGPTGSP